jgi:hypothetical protein
MHNVISHSTINANGDFARRGNLQATERVDDVPVGIEGFQFVHVQQWRWHGSNLMPDRETVKDLRA